MDPTIALRKRTSGRKQAGEPTGGPIPEGVTDRALGTFFALAFALTWGIAALLILFPEPVEAAFGPRGTTNPLFILAVYAPGLAGLFLAWRSRSS